MTVRGEGSEADEVTKGKFANFHSVADFPELNRPVPTGRERATIESPCFQGEQKMRYLYYDGERIIAEREGNSWVVRYLLGLKSCGQVVNGQVRVYHADRLGSVRWVTDGSGNLVASYVYEGFGKVVGQSGGGGGPYQFCGLWGYRNDNDAGLLHVGARYYEVETGRWVQKDKWLGSIVTSQSLNCYAYCMMNPVVFVDPAGTWWVLLVRL